jgi:uncharacterized protein DUF2795
MVERGSDKFGPRIDEELERRTQPLERGSPVPSRAEEFLEEEAPADDEPGTDVRPTTGDAEARAELARHLQPSVFPADRGRLLASARDLNAPPSTIALLEQLPEGGRRFSDIADVWEALGSAP